MSMQHVYSSKCVRMKFAFVLLSETTIKYCFRDNVANIMSCYRLDAGMRF